MTSRPGPELLELIGEDAFVRLAEAFGGTRLFIPIGLTADHEIAQAVGMTAALHIVERFAPDTIRVPLARELRAQRYRTDGVSNTQIARRLGITETGVEKVFKRQRERIRDDVHTARALRVRQYHDAGKSVAQIAMALGLPEPTVESLLTAAPANPQMSLLDLL